MKKLIFVPLFFVLGLVLSAQSWNPFVGNGEVHLYPLLPWEFDGTGVLSLTIGNSGTDPIPLVTNQEMTLVITLANGVPDNVDPLASLGGTWLAYFDWTYLPGVNTYFATQNQEIPGSSQGNITIDYKVTINTPVSISGNGFNVNIQPPPFTNSYNKTDDDAVSAYTYVRATDYGDVPLSYGVVFHEINVFKDPTNTFYLNYMYLGNGVGHKSEYPDCAEADCDDFDDGLVFPEMIAGTTVTIPVKLTIEDAEMSGAFGRLNAWIDWNGDGVFNNADGEKIITGFFVDYDALGESNSATLFFNVDIPPDAVTNTPTFARFRFGNNVTNANQQPVITWGEVEDYMINILPAELDSQIELLKSGTWNDLNNDGFAQAGETINYSFTVANTGNYTISGIDIDDVRVGVMGLALTPSILAPGEIGTASFVYTITQSDINDGGVYNLALAKGKAPNGEDIEAESKDPNPLDPDDADYDPGCPDCTYTELPKLAEIVSFVWHDLNGNGIQDHEEPGIPNAEVELFICDPDSINPIKSTTSDSIGNYSFEDIIPGSYYVKFHLPDDYEFTFPLQGDDPALNSDVTGAKGYGTTACFTIGISDQYTDIDAGAFVCAELGQTVWHDSNMSDIFDNGENGINGVKVKLYRWHNDSWVLWNLDFTRTNPNPEPFCDDGYYYFCTAPGKYYIEFVIPQQGLVPVRPNIGNNPDIDSDITGEFGPGTTDDFILVSGTPGILNLDAGFYDQAMVTHGIVWIDENADGIRDADELVVPNVMVELYDITGELRRTTLTDKDGGYEFTYLQADEYFIKFIMPAELSESHGFTIPYHGDSEYNSDVTSTFGYGTTENFSLSPGEETKYINAGLVAISLPVNFISLGAKWSSDYTDVYWTTANEINADKYIVQRSFDSIESFESIGEVKAKNGNLNSYLFEDRSEFRDGIYYYRLIQLDKDGITSISRIVAIFVSSQTSRDMYIAYPNPAYGKANVRMILSDRSDIRMDLFDMNGQKLISDIVRGNYSAGIYDFSFNVNDLDPSSYLLRIINGDLIEFKEIIVVR